MRTKHLLGVVIILLGIVSDMQAQSGATCQDAIPLGKDYKKEISGPQTVWYTAWTFDLPLAVYFMPLNEADPAPEVEMDFSCTTGVYKDSILCSLFCPNSGSGIQFDMPHKPKLKTDHIDGKLVYYIAMGKEYRDLLLKTGISYNVEVFVKVTYHSAGTMSIAPDNMFSSCMDGARFLHLEDSVRFKAKEKDKHVIVPYVQWQHDSIYYIWKGNASVKLQVGSECEFDPTDDMEEVVLQRLTIKPNDTAKVASEKISHYVHFEDNEAGMFFAKCYSNEEGMLIVKKVPQAPPRGGATLLQYDKRVAIGANDTNALYAIPHSWDTATILTTPTDHIFRMYISTEPEFLLKDAFASYQFLASDKGHWLGLFQEEMKTLWEKTTEQYLYVRFECSARTTLLPEIWSPSECLSHTLISKGETTIDVKRSSYGAQYYRFYYYDWRGGNMTFKWTLKTNNCPTFIGDSCSFSTSASAPHVVANKTIAKNSSWVIPKEQVAEWADKTDPDGYLYIRFNASQEGEMIVSTDAPEETDPVYPHTTIKVACADESGKNITVSVSEAQHVTLSGDGGAVEEWDAAPGETKAISLESGSYVLQGENEQLIILVP